MDYEKPALDYHAHPTPGKIKIDITKPLNTQTDLSLAYSPGVAGPCREIAKRPDDSFLYTIRGNLVGVISNGTAVLGLGAIGPYAAKPVMEGKAMLFKKFADIDVFDIEVDADDPDIFIQTVKSLEPTFGGINLEDIKAPECFYIEEMLREKMEIPVFHDDQHGTAIIVGAALLNALELTKRKIDEVKVVFSGAGAAAMGCAMLLRDLGIPLKNLHICDSVGVLRDDRTDLNPFKRRFAIKTKAHSMEDALEDADVFIGVSVADILKPHMLLKMAKNPIVFALSNPNPEINPEVAKKTRDDVIIATGRSDYPNQVNNVLGFPYIFRGALDVRAKTINNEMKLAAVRAIAELAKEHVPDEVLSVYKQVKGYTFGKDYLIPKPVDPRVLLRVAPAVAKAAMDSGVARIQVNMDEYKKRIEAMLGPTRLIVSSIRSDLDTIYESSKRRAKVVLPFGADPKIIRAVKEVAEQGDVNIILLGTEKAILAQAKKVGVDSLGLVEFIDPMTDPRRESLANAIYDLRKRHGISRTMSHQIVSNHNYFAATMLHLGEVDALVNGITSTYIESVRPILEIIGAKPDQTLAGVYMMVKDKSLKFFADCTINIEPSPEEIANIAISTAQVAREYTTDPIRVALLSFANFGASRHTHSRIMAQALEIIKAKAPDLEVDGEMQVDVALNHELREKEFPFANIKGDANVLIFPNLSAANIGYKLLTNMGGVTSTGPILAGLNKPANVLQRVATVSEIVNMIYVSAHQALGVNRRRI